jgi:DNA-binding CsgD family transcriptional regulator
MKLDLALLDFVGRLYELPTESHAWPARLDEFTAFIGGKAAALLVQDPLREWIGLQLFSSLYDAQMMVEYNTHWVRYEQHGYDHLVRSHHRGFVSDREACGLTSDAEYAIHPPAQWFRDRYGVGYRYASRLNTTGAWIDLLAVNFGVERHPMTAEEKAFGELFLPHFAKVIELQRTFRLLESRRRAALEALDRLDIGVLITTGQATLVLANRIGQDMLAARDALRPGPRGDVAGGAELASSIAEVAATAEARSDIAEKVLSINRRSGRAPLLATVSPLRDTRTGLGSSFRGAIVFVIDPENPRSITTRGMETLFDLTDAESKVLELIVSGSSTDEIAQTRAVSPNTVRSQIKSLLEKTGSSQRADLVRLAAAVNPPIKD